MVGVEYLKILVSALHGGENKRLHKNGVWLQDRIAFLSRLTFNLSLSSAGVERDEKTAVEVVHVWLQ